MSDVDQTLASVLGRGLAVVEHNLSLVESGEGGDPGLAQALLDCARELELIASQEQDEEQAERASSLVFCSLALINTGAKG